MNQFYVLFLFHLSLVLSACYRGNQLGKPELNNDRCIKHWFEQGQGDILYGRECLEGKKLFIQTYNEGRLAITTNAVSNEEGKESLRLEGDVEKTGKNKFYEVGYKILKDQGDYNHRSIRPFLPSSESSDNPLKRHEKFFGSLNHKYQIVFKAIGNHLILYKASKNIEDIPYTEWSSLLEENGLFMVPFLGYLIEYCNAENILSRQSGHETYKYRIKCGDFENSNEAQYFRIAKDSRQLYKYADKKDLFPASYFVEGRWFLSQGEIETPSREAHFSVSNAYLVELNKQTNSFKIMDVSGNVTERSQQIVGGGLPSINWVQYEMALNGLKFEQFGERKSQNNFDNPTDRPYVTLQFDNINKSGGQVTNVIVANDYFSYLIDIPREFTVDGKSFIKNVKHKVSLLRENVLDQKGFIPKKWFKDDNDHVFGVVNASPQTVEKEGEQSEKDEYKAYRVMRFNTSGKETVIKWHFSKNTVQDSFYRNIGREAVNVFNRAFEIITKDSDKKIKVVLAEDEGDKDLGDPRYNILNIVKTEELSPNLFGGGGYVFLGAVPVYVNPNTGQVIGSTVNIFAQSIEDSYNKLVRAYIRYEIFRQEDRTAVNESEIHVITPYMRKKIRNQCQEVEKFIDLKRKLNDLNPRDDLKDKELVLACGKRISRERILATTLHEMLHSFGAGHNNRSSTDKENYYKTAEEIKKYFPMANVSEEDLPKTSSVEDYMPNEVPQLTVLGKYDINFLRYLYMDQVETKDGNLLDLNTPEDVEKQKSLSSKKDVLSQMKAYAHCADTIQSQKNINVGLSSGQMLSFSILDINAEDFLCLPYDYGSNPKEIVKFEIDGFRRNVNRIKYRYDGKVSDIEKKNQDLWGSIYNFTYKIAYFYAKWIQLRDLHLNRHGLENMTRLVFSSAKEEESIENYKKAIKRPLSGFKKEYAQYYSIREMIADFYQDLIFTETMKCKTSDEQGKVRFFSLNTIRDKLLDELGDQLYVRDCRSKHITDFLTKNNLSLVNQLGAENFRSYYPKGINSIVDVIAEADMVKGLQVFVDAVSKLNNNMLVSSLTQFEKEPDLFHKYVDRLLQKELFEKGPDKSSFELEQLLRFIKVLQKSILFNLVQLSQQPNAKLFLQTLAPFLSVTYNTGKGNDSFYSSVVEPLLLKEFASGGGRNLRLNDDNSIIESTMTVPFVAESYKAYVKTKSVSDEKNNILLGFEKYLKNKDNVLNSGTSFTVPFESGGFAEKVIKTYNENSKLISDFVEERREQKKDTLITDIEIMDQQQLSSYNKVLEKIARELLVNPVLTKR